MHKETIEMGLSGNTSIFSSDSHMKLACLVNQRRFMNDTIQGPLAGLPPLPHDAPIPDLACSADGLALDIAFEQRAAEVNGADSSQSIVMYADARIRSTPLPNVSFGRMDITGPLYFSDVSFDLMQDRFLTEVLKQNACLVFIAECTLIARPDGMLNLTREVR